MCPGGASQLKLLFAGTVKRYVYNSANSLGQECDVLMQKLLFPITSISLHRDRTEHVIRAATFLSFFYCVMREDSEITL